MRMNVLISEAVTALVGLFVIFEMTKAFCETDANFCWYGWRIFSVVFVAAYFLLKYGLTKGRI